MNKIYRAVFNEVVGVWQAVAEVGAARGKSSGAVAAVGASVTLRAGALLLGAAAAIGAPDAEAAGGAGGVDWGRLGFFVEGPAGGTSALPIGTNGTGREWWIGSQLRTIGQGGGGGGFNASTGVSAAGGWGGGIAPFANGGAGGAAGSVQSASGGGTTPGNFTGMAGQSGASASTVDQGFVDGGGGGGASGSAGLLTQGSGTRVLGGNIAGGAGGAGGNAGHTSDARGGGGGGGEGGAGVLLLSGDLTLNASSTVRGGRGGKGGDVLLAASSGMGGYGGDGGVALWWSGSGGTLTNAGTIAGGDGGASGTTYYYSPSGGKGGAGVQGNGFALTNSGTISGGNGGSTYNAGGGGASKNTGGAAIAGNNLTVTNDGGIFGGSGGDNSGVGGAGIASSTLTLTNGGRISGGSGGNYSIGGVGISGNNLTLTNTGSISGGNGGINAVGAGIGVSGRSVVLVNSGTIRGGTGKAGSGVQADAIAFTGGNNVLQIHPGSVIHGNVVGATGSGTNDVLRLAGTTSDVFDVSTIGSAAQYRNFDGFEKVDTGNWTLQGSTAALTPWVISGGALSISADSNLGAAEGSLTLQGGTLQSTGAVTTARDVTLGASGGTFKPDAGTTLTLSGVTRGTGSLTMAGAGSLVLSSANTYTGGTVVQSGTLALGAGGTSGSIAGNVAVSGSASTLSFNRSDAVNYSGQISGSGGVRQIGTGTTTLTGINTYTGGTTVQSGTLQSGAHSALVDNTAYTVNGGMLDLNGRNLTATTLSGTGGTVALNGATLAVNQGIDSSYAGAVTGAGAGSKLLKGGTGTLTLSGTNTYIGGTTLSGGRLVGSAASFGSGAIVDDATLEIHQAIDASMAHAISGTGALVKTGAGTLTLSGSNSYAGGTAVQGGTLSVASDTRLGAASGPLTLDGGRLQSTATFSTSRAIAFGAAGGGFDPSAGTTLTLGGVVSGAGALTQAGAGTLVLAGDSLAYNGPVHVNAGTLAVNGAIGSNVQVHGGTLGGSGRIDGHVNVASGGTLSPGNSPGTLTLGGDLVLNNGATSLFQLGQSGAVGGASNDLVEVGGDLALGGALRASASSAGWYRLFEYAGALSGQFDTQQVGSTGGSFTVAGHQLDTSQRGQINLSVLGSGQTLQFWRGTTGGVWNGFTSAWVNDAPTNTTPATWLGSVAVFGSDAGATPGTVTVQGLQSFDTLQFSANGYHLVADSSGATPGRLVMAPATGTQATINTDAGISAGISASIVDGVGNALVKVGGGTLTLSGANTYTGGTQVNEGLLVAGSHGALGSGAVTVDNGADRGATLQVASGVTLANAITLNNGGMLDNAGTLAAAGAPVRAVTGAATVFNRAGATILGDVALNATGANAVSLFSGSQILGDLNIGSHTAASLTLDGSAPDQLYSQAVTGSTTFAGELVKSGSGGWTLDRALAPVSTTVHGGTLALRGAGDLGGSGGVDLTASGAALDISAANGHRGIGRLSGVAGSTVELGTHTLTFGDASDPRFAGAIGGTGGMIKQGTGTQTLAGASTYSGGTELKAGRIDLGHSEALGSGVLAMDDGTTLGFVADGLRVANAIRMTGTNDPTFDTGVHSATLTGGISGSADLTKQGSGTLILGAANNSYSGATTIAEGTLRAGVANAFSASSAVTIARGATLDLAGFDQRVAGISHSGTVSLMGRVPGTTLTVTGPWVGQGGTLAVSTALGDNRSATDKLMLSGASAVASGNTQVAITNIGGLGGQTTGDGIEIVGTQNGASIQGQVFALSAPVLAGAYDYQLHNTASGAYLSSTTTAVPGPTPTPTSYRAEVPLYAALPEQLREANLGMLATLHQRVGDAGVASGGDAQGQRQAWGRIVSLEREIGQGGAVSPHSEGRLTGFQAGTDLWADAHWRAGLYVGQLDGDMKVTGFARGIDRYAAGRNDLKNQYLGGYATYRNDEGLYVDGVLQAGRHRSTLGPDGFLSSQNKGHSVLASVEVGRSFSVASSWRIEPQFQLVHQRLSLNDSALVGAQVQQDPASSWAARIGVRLKSSIATAAGTLQPYARLDVWHSDSGTDRVRFIGPAAATDISTPTGGTRTEAALGGHWQVSPNVGVYGELGQMWVAGGSVRTEGGPNASVGVKVRW